MTPSVSVVVIFLNADRFLGEAIESVYAQTYEDWELCLVDDGSTDRSSEIASSYAAQDRGRVRYLEHPDHKNLGMSASRNLGVRHAQGRFIAFLDADDVWMPQKLAEQVAILDQQPEAAGVYGVSEYWWSWTGKPEDLRRDSVPPLGVPPNTLVRPPKLMPSVLNASIRTPSQSNLLMRADAVRQLGGFHEGFRGMYEDQVFFSKMYLKATVYVTGACWDRYRQHPESCVSIAKRTGEKYSAGLRYLDWLAGFLKSEHIEDPEIWRALTRKRWRYRLPTLFRRLDEARRRLHGITASRAWSSVRP